MPPQHKGYLRWEISRRVANYYVLRMPPDTMYRRLYLVINQERSLIRWQDAPGDERYRESWFVITARRTITLINMDHLKWGERWLHKYWLEMVAIDVDHYIYVKGMNPKMKRKWRKTKPDIMEQWRIYVDQQINGIRGDQPGWAGHYSSYMRLDGGRTA